MTTKLKLNYISLYLTSIQACSLNTAITFKMLVALVVNPFYKKLGTIVASAIKNTDDRC